MDLSKEQTVRKHLACLEVSKTLSLKPSKCFELLIRRRMLEAALVVLISDIKMKGDNNIVLEDTSLIYE